MSMQQPAQLLCNTQIDYSEIMGDRILPFVIELNLDTSILNPAPGQNQRFCYTVTGVGEGSREFADLSHLVLGICDQIPESQIVNITVVIDGQEQNVVFGEGGNVELRTPENPDPRTGCPGLKFDFGLNKVNGIMVICFELTAPRTVCPNAVCLFGGGVTAEGLSICGPCCGELGTCTITAYQPATICVPVRVRPYARVGTVITHCCGEPTITPNTSMCADGTLNGVCTFTITQDICVEVPVVFGARASVGAPSVQCGDATGEDICTNCGVDDSLSSADPDMNEKKTGKTQRIIDVLLNHK